MERMNNNKKNDTQVMILKKQYTISGFESSEYLQRLAYFINNKYEEVKSLELYKTLDMESKNILLAINLADEYLKLKGKNENTKADYERQADEIGSLRREILDYRTKLETIIKERDMLKEKLVEEQKKVVKLETELSVQKKQK
ncbi:MAG: cell division protein ZapA [Lachnospiraceae bacterium]|nr:cell division protein ZapA [Lachnospiraceae bacterium]